ncbi:MAG: MBL fold metallo-hydrolase [Deltaproteobacteria bacterium]|nr:MBL fold metallo-hydrolase [Deltaproteobacteria bacterium]
MRTPTLPPATHTNTYVVGEGALTVFDPASPWEDERTRLALAIQERLDGGERIERIVLTHHHQDHVSGAEALRVRFATPEHPIPIVAHPITAGLVAHHIRVDDAWEGEETLTCGGRRLTALFTPGHAPGHLVFQDEDSGVMIAGDMVAGIGTVLISPLDGDLGAYLDSLQAMRSRSPSLLLPAHGDALPQAEGLLAFYIAHRHQRTEQIRQALDVKGVTTPRELVRLVYTDLAPVAWPVAEAQILSHLRWMARHGLAQPQADETRWVG